MCVLYFIFSDISWNFVSGNADLNVPKFSYYTESLFKWDPKYIFELLWCKE